MIVLSGEINKKLAEVICNKLLVLDSEGDGSIRMFIDSPGGDGMALGA